MDQTHHQNPPNMISVDSLEKIAVARLADGKALCREGRYVAASYLCGYCIEIKLKARICRHLGWNGFPETSKEFNNYRSLQTHSLNVLLSLTGLEAFILADHLTEWLEVESWNPMQRYQLENTIRRDQTERTLMAAAALLNVL